MSVTAVVTTNLFFHILPVRWWRTWCEYVAVYPEYDRSGCFVTGCQMNRAVSAIKQSFSWKNSELQNRPDEIDNTTLQVSFFLFCDAPVVQCH